MRGAAPWCLLVLALSQPGCIEYLGRKMAVDSLRERAPRVQPWSRGVLLGRADCLDRMDMDDPSFQHCLDDRTAYHIRELLPVVRDERGRAHMRLELRCREDRDASESYRTCWQREAEIDRKRELAEWQRQVAGQRRRADEEQRRRLEEERRQRNEQRRRRRAEREERRAEAFAASGVTGAVPIVVSQGFTKPARGFLTALQLRRTRIEDADVERVVIDPDSIWLDVRFRSGPHKECADDAKLRRRFSADSLRLYQSLCVMHWVSRIMLVRDLMTTVAHKFRRDGMEPREFAAWNPTVAGIRLQGAEPKARVAIWWTMNRGVWWTNQQPAITTRCAGAEASVPGSFYYFAGPMVDVRGRRTGVGVLADCVAKMSP